MSSLWLLISNSFYDLNIVALKLCCYLYVRLDLRLALISQGCLTNDCSIRVNDTCMRCLQIPRDDCVCGTSIHWSKNHYLYTTNRKSCLRLLLTCLVTGGVVAIELEC